MLFYTAVYVLGDTEYNSFIHAETLETAKKLASRRNINEEILGTYNTKDLPSFNPQPLPSTYYTEAAFLGTDTPARIKRLIACTHLLTFYSWIAARAKLIDATQHVLSDQGLIHEILHEVEFPEEYGFRLAIYENMQSLEACIPGLYTKHKTYKDQLVRTQVKFWKDIRVKKDILPHDLKNTSEEKEEEEDPKVLLFPSRIEH